MSIKKTCFLIFISISLPLYTYAGIDGAYDGPDYSSDGTSSSGNLVGNNDTPDYEPAEHTKTPDNDTSGSSGSTGNSSDDDDDDDSDRWGSSDDDSQNSGSSNSNSDNYVDLVSAYDGFVDPNEYYNHVEAVSYASEKTTQNCQSGCSTVEEVTTFNENYYKSLSQKNTSLPKGPMETMLEYNAPAATSSGDVANFNNSQDGKDLLAAVDYLVREGQVAAVMPGQMELAFPDLQGSLSSIQELGAQNSVVLLDNSNQHYLVANGANAQVSVYGGSGGTVVIGNNVSDGDVSATVSHELTHAGELTLESYSDEGKLNQLSGDQQTTVEAAVDLVESYGVDSDGVHCSDCEVLKSMPTALTSYGEARAYASMEKSYSQAGRNYIHEYAETLVSYSNGNLSMAEAERMATDVLTGGVINDQRGMIDAAAQIVIDHGL